MKKQFRTFQDAKQYARNLHLVKRTQWVNLAKNNKLPKDIPHDPVKEQVNCANLCHLKTPFSQERFSHERIIEVYKKSAHAPQPGDSTQLKEAKPDCKFCHLNPMYTRVSEERIDYHETLSRCLNCHQEKGVTPCFSVQPLS